MEALFQIGKEIGTLTARVSALESKDHCDCKSKTKGIPISALPEKQREILVQLRKNHKDIFADMNEVLKRYGLGDKVKVSTFHLNELGVARPNAGAGSDECCYCCSNDDVSGWDWCCSDECIPCCA